MVRTEMKSLLIYSIEILTIPLVRFKILNKEYLSFAKDLLYDFMTFQSCFIFLLQLLM